MYHVRLIFRNRSLSFTNYVECRESRFLMRNQLCSKDQLGVSRLFCSSKSKDEKPTETEKTESEVNTSESSKEGTSGNDAKAKLQNLLKSIIKDSKEAAERKSQQPEDKKVDMKLAVPIRTKPPSSQVEKDVKTADDIETEKNLGKEMTMAVKVVAENVEGDPKTVESELVQKLKTSVGKKLDLTDIFAGMKIDRSQKVPTPSTSTMNVDLSRAHRVRRLLNEQMLDPKSQDMQKMRSDQRSRRRPPTDSRHPSYIPIDLFGSPRLGIFVDKSDAPTEGQPETPKLETWEALHARDLKLAVTHPPANGFEEMILWTEQGKLWKFPIDNEQGLEEEAKVPFHEHVFLEPQIEDWCPKKGPIRHFMELVCVGLSKNPFLTVKEKHDQIEWYHQYFKNKNAIIKELGAGEIK